MTDMDVVLNIDDGYVQHCGATLNSLFRSNPDSQFHIHIMTVRLSDDNERLLREFVESRGSRLSVWRTDGSRVEQLPNLAGHHISAATYLRLFMAELLPESVDKALYIDADLLVRHDVTELWNLPLEKYSHAAVEDAPNNGAQQRLGYDPVYPYFNAGMMLVNLRYWRENNVQARLMDYLDNNADKIVHHDQDVLNAVLHKEVLFADIKWNMLKCFFRDPPRIQQKYLPVLEESRKDPAVVHFTGKLKPWDCWINHPLAYEYFEALKGTPWEGYRYTPSSVIRKRGFAGGLASILGIEKLSYRVRGKLKN